MSYFDPNVVVIGFEIFNDSFIPVCIDKKAIEAVVITFAATDTDKKVICICQYEIILCKQRAKHKKPYLPVDDGDLSVGITAPSLNDNSIIFIKGKMRAFDVTSTYDSKHISLIRHKGRVLDVTII